MKRLIVVASSFFSFFNLMGIKHGGTAPLNTTTHVYLTRNRNSINIRQGSHRSSPTTMIN